jgi:hypothetical protein
MLGYRENSVTESPDFYQPIENEPQGRGFVSKTSVHEYPLSYKSPSQSYFDSWNALEYFKNYPTEPNLSFDRTFPKNSEWMKSPKKNACAEQMQNYTEPGTFSVNIYSQEFIIFILFVIIFFLIFTSGFLIQKQINMLHVIVLKQSEK